LFAKLLQACVPAVSPCAVFVRCAWCPPPPTSLLRTCSHNRSGQHCFARSFFLFLFNASLDQTSLPDSTDHSGWHQGIHVGVWWSFISMCPVVCGDCWSLILSLFFFLFFFFLSFFSSSSALDFLFFFCRSIFGTMRPRKKSWRSKTSSWSHPKKARPWLRRSLRSSTWSARR
jgi:hypothetical protein